MLNPFTDRIPPGATIITPPIGEDFEIGRGYIAQTGQDYMYLTIRDTDKGPHVVVLSPEIARYAADRLIAHCDQLDALNDTGGA